MKSSFLAACSIEVRIPGWLSSRLDRSTANAPVKRGSPLANSICVLRLFKPVFRENVNDTRSLCTLVSTHPSICICYYGHWNDSNSDDAPGFTINGCDNAYVEKLNPGIDPLPHLAHCCPYLCIRAADGGYGMNLKLNQGTEGIFDSPSDSYSVWD